MKRSRPLRPGKPLKRRSELPGGAPPKRRAPIRAKNPTRGHRFRKRRDPAYCAWIRTLPCVLAYLGECAGRVECAHVRSRAAGGDDAANTIPCCTRHHRQSHNVGQKSWATYFGFDPAAEAVRLAGEYPARAPAPRDEG